MIDPRPSGEFLTKKLFMKLSGVSPPRTLVTPYPSHLRQRTVAQTEQRPRGLPGAQLGQFSGALAPAYFQALWVSEIVRVLLGLRADEGRHHRARLGVLRPTVCPTRKMPKGVAGRNISDSTVIDTITGKLQCSFFSLRLVSGKQGHSQVTAEQSVSLSSGFFRGRP